MSLHKSLRHNKFESRQRSVRKRWERVKYLMDKNDQRLPVSVFGLPKEKIARMKKVKTEKKKAEINLAKLI